MTHRIALLALIVLNAVGCRTEPLDPEDAEPYELCFATDDDATCSDGVSECRRSPLGTRHMCITECVVDEDCPSHDGLRPVCERFVRGGGLCVLRCNPHKSGGDDRCPYGTACEEVERANENEFGVCMPDS